MLLVPGPVNFLLLVAKAPVGRVAAIVVRVSNSPLSRHRIVTNSLLLVGLSFRGLFAVWFVSFLSPF